MITTHAMTASEESALNARICYPLREIITPLPSPRIASSRARSFIDVVVYFLLDLRLYGLQSFNFHRKVRDLPDRYRHRGNQRRSLPPARPSKRSRPSGRFQSCTFHLRTS